MEGSFPFSLLQGESGSPLVRERLHYTVLYKWLDLRNIDRMIVELCTANSDGTSLQIRRHDILLDEISAHGPSVGFVLRGMTLMKSGSYLIRATCHDANGFELSSFELPSISISHDVEYWTNCWLAHGMVI